MSGHTNNSRQPSRRGNGAYASYGNDQRIRMDLISPPSHPFSPTMNEGVGVDPWWLLQDRILTLPAPFMSYSRPRMQVLVLHNNFGNNTHLRPRPMYHAPPEDTILTIDEQKKVVEKLKKEIYNPTPKKIIQRLGRFYRQNDAKKVSGETQKIEKELVEEEDDGKKCAICLEEFEAKEVVMLTPCNHMFHEDCILPWVKSHGRCPVCRFSFRDRIGASGASSTNNDNMVDDTLTSDVISFVTSGVTSTTVPFWF